MNDQLTKPLPTPTPVSLPFWSGLQQQQVCLQRCNPCGFWIFYPRSCCPRCLSADLNWHEVSGAGVLYTFTIARQPTAPHFVDELPQQIGVVELPEGVRLTTTLVNVEPKDIRVGMALTPVFDAVDEHTTLLRYQPA